MPTPDRLPAPLPTGDPAFFSWWQQDLRRDRLDAARPPLAGERTADVAIVGGGYTGLWTALALKAHAPQLSIVLLDAGRCGDGASSRNGGSVHGYWGSLATLRSILGDDRALEIARLGSRAQDAIRSFATAPGRDTWWRDAGYLRVAASDRQEHAIAAILDAAKALGVEETVRRLAPDEVAGLCRSPAFRGGLFFAEGATVHPARLAAALRRAVVEAGVDVYEGAAAVGIDRGDPVRVRTAAGAVIAKDVVLANYTGTLAVPAVRRRTTVFSSFPIMSNPAPEALAAANWTRPHGIADLRMFVHYFRRTPDGRVLMGAGSGPIAPGADDMGLALRRHAETTERAVQRLERFLPEVAKHGIAARWGWPLEVSSDRLPFFGTVPGRRIHYGSGYSGHGVNATYIGGQCLASLVLRRVDEWSTSPFCTRRQPRMPPEPFRVIGGRAVRWGILACEDAEDTGGQGPMAARAVAALPKLLNLRIGVR